MVKFLTLLQYAVIPGFSLPYSGRLPVIVSDFPTIQYFGLLLSDSKICCIKVYSSVSVFQIKLYSLNLYEEMAYQSQLQTISLDLPMGSLRLSSKTIP